jgi:predicted glycosyltransferase
MKIQAILKKQMTEIHALMKQYKVPRRPLTKDEIKKLPKKFVQASEKLSRKYTKIFKKYMP